MKNPELNQPQPKPAEDEPLSKYPVVDKILRNLAYAAYVGAPPLNGHHIIKRPHNDNGASSGL